MGWRSDGLKRWEADVLSFHHFTPLTDSTLEVGNLLICMSNTTETGKTAAKAFLDSDAYVNLGVRAFSEWFEDDFVCGIAGEMDELFDAVKPTVEEDEAGYDRACDKVRREVKRAAREEIKALRSKGESVSTVIDMLVEDGPGYNIEKET